MCALSISLLAGARANAQIVNVQPLIAASDAEGVSGVVDASVDVRTGNSELLLLSGSLLTRYRAGRHLIFLLARQEFGVQGGQRFLDKDFEHLRYRLALAPAFQMETFVQHDRDPFRRLALRVLWGAGPRFVLASSDATELAVGAAYMLEFERLGVAPEPDSGQKRWAHRLSTYVTWVAHLDDRISVGESAYAQPRLDDPKDIRILNESELLVSLNEVLHIKLTFSLGYDSSPPSGRRGLDTVSKSSLQLRF